MLLVLFRRCIYVNLSVFFFQVFPSGSSELLFCNHSWFLLQNFESLILISAVASEASACKGDPSPQAIRTLCKKHRCNADFGNNVQPARQDDIFNLLPQRQWCFFLVFFPNRSRVCAFLQDLWDFSSSKTNKQETAFFSHFCWKKNIQSVIPREWSCWGQKPSRSKDVCAWRTGVLVPLLTNKTSASRAQKTGEAFMCSTFSSVNLISCASHKPPTIFKIHLYISVKKKVQSHFSSIPILYSQLVKGNLTEIHTQTHVLQALSAFWCIIPSTLTSKTAVSIPTPEATIVVICCGSVVQLALCMWCAPAGTQQFLKG